MVEREATLPWDTHVPAHTTHPYETLRLERWSPLRAIDPIRAALAVASEVECAVTGTRLVRHRAHVTLRPLLLRLCFGALRGLRVELREYAYDACGDLVVDDGLVVLADDIDAEFLQKGGRETTTPTARHGTGIFSTYDDVVGLELEGVGLEPLGAEPLAVDEGAVGAFHVLYPDLDDEWFESARRGRRGPLGAQRALKAHLAVLLPHLCVLPAEHLGIKVAIAFCGDGLRVGLAADLDALVVDEGDVFGDEGVIERVQVERRKGHGGVRGGEGGRHHGRRRQQRAGR